uniref:Uncharacterized protein n=1 Tax=Panagrellus redivivus TaxID=6233 RepID=A0A7E4ZQM8_PANRE
MKFDFMVSYDYINSQPFDYGCAQRAHTTAFTSSDEQWSVIRRTISCEQSLSSWFEYAAIYLSMAILIL